jgi:L-asparaginase
MKVAHINTATPNPPQSSILIIYTGGTLGMAYDKAHRNLVPFDFEQILKKMPELRQFECELTVFSFETLIDSSNVSPAIWIQLAETIGKHYDKYDGFVVLHGTDTMAYSASALSYLLEGLNKPVIFTGAQLPIGAVRNDARRNLSTSIEIAAAKENGQAIVPEVAVFFNDMLLRGNRVRKIESTLFDAFHSENYPELAKVGIHIAYNHPVIRTVNLDKRLRTYTQMADSVAILKLFPGINEQGVKGILGIAGLKGIVLETYGSGNAPTAAWFIKALQEAIDTGVIIYNVSQCIGGQVVLGRYATSRHLLEIGVVSGGNITTEAAITKLMFLLAQNIAHADRIRLLATNLRGEMS